jgi:putative ABC transport system permease protein
MKASATTARPGQAGREKGRTLGLLRRHGSVPLARRSLLRDRVRLALSVGGFGFAVLLVLLLRGIMDGTVAKSTTYIDRVGADVFVSGAGVRNMALSSSALPASVVADLARAPGVERSSGILRMEVMASGPEAQMPAVLLGYEPGQSPGGPWKLQAGRSLAGPGEAVIDGVLAGEVGAELGSTVQVGGKPLRVVGISSGTAALAGKLLFISLADAQEILRMPDVVGFVLLKLTPGVDASAMAEQLGAAHPDLTVQTRSELSRNDREVLSGLFVTPITMMSRVGLLVGLAIVGLTMYTTTAERLRDFGVLKAMGAPNRYLFKVVMTQAFALGLAGFTLGVAAAVVAGPVIEAIAPAIGSEVRLMPAVLTLGEVLGMSLAGAVIPVARIIGVDPLIVFRR